MTVQTMSRFILACVLASGCSKEVEVHYQAVEDPGFGVSQERGWIPSVLPTTSRNIDLYYIVETGEVWGRFDFDPRAEASAAFRQDLETHDERARCWRVVPVTWFDPDPRLAHYSKGRFLYAVDWMKGRSYFWTCGPFIAQAES